MDHRGVPFEVLTTIRDKANVYSSAERCEYNGKTGVQLPNNVFQQREYVGNVIVRRESQLSDAEWATAKPLKAAVGDRAVWGLGSWAPAVLPEVLPALEVLPGVLPEVLPSAQVLLAQALRPELRPRLRLLRLPVTQAFCFVYTCSHSAEHSTERRGGKQQSKRNVPAPKVNRLIVALRSSKRIVGGVTPPHGV